MVENIMMYCAAQFVRSCQFVLLGADSPGLFNIRIDFIRVCWAILIGTSSTVLRSEAEIDLFTGKLFYEILLLPSS